MNPFKSHTSFIFSFSKVYLVPLMSQALYSLSSWRFHLCSERQTSIRTYITWLVVTQSMRKRRHRMWLRVEVEFHIRVRKPPLLRWHLSLVLEAGSVPSVWLGKIHAIGIVKPQGAWSLVSSLLLLPVLPPRFSANLYNLI